MYIFDTTHNKTRDIYAPDTTQSQNTNHHLCQVYGYKDFHGQIPYNYKLL